MARKKRTSANQGPNIGLIAKQTRRKKPIGSELLLDIDPITDNQKKLFDYYDEGLNLVAHGVPGSGKTFISLYKALKDVLDVTTPYETVYIVRSLVQTRSIGYMPGDESQKQGYFETPYKNMVRYMFQLPSDSDFEMLYDNLKTQRTIKFYNTSFLRGLTFDNCIIIVDEFENLSLHEMGSIITRVGEDCKIIFSGDAEQSDLVNTNERNGIHDFMRILEIMDSFRTIEFGVDDIVRSGLVKQYILAKRELNL